VVALPAAMSSARDPEAKNPRLFDVRTVERNIKKGLITRKDYEKFLKSLGDSSEKVVPPDQPPPPDDDDLDDDEEDDEVAAGPA
jgi:hypothetical protein